MRKITVKTVYENCSDEFVEDYIQQLCFRNDLLKARKNDFLEGKEISFESNDPTSDCFARTSYKLENVE